MSQHDQVLDNQTGASFRSDLNNALAALFSSSSGASAPTTTVAYQWWADTTTGILKQRNAANTAWVSVMVMATGVVIANAALAGSASQAFSSSNFTTAQGLQFPATQNPSSDVNNLDDYEEGPLTLTLTFDTPGDLSVAYTYKEGRYTKIGRSITVSIAIATSTFTHTTSSGNLKITGLPFTAASVQDTGGCALAAFKGITKAGGYTQYAVTPVSGQAYCILTASGSGATDLTVTATDMPTGTAKLFYGEFTYQI